jgi:ubiquinone/menaquinone biosynthesis C-methylase UbiE
MILKSKRTMEPESMETLEEVYAYDKLTLKYLTILHNGFIETILNFSPAAGKFLEVGCGTGRIAIGVAKHTQGIEVEGVDLSENMLTVAWDNATLEGVVEKVKFSIGDAKQLPFDDNSFDTVYCHNMLHHIPEPLLVVREMNRVVKDDGAILIRDLIRLPSPFIHFHVHIFGLPYNKLMKKEYRDSIKAALSPEEWLDLYSKSGIIGARVSKHFLTHQGIERPAKNRRRKYVTIPAPFLITPFKKMYVSKPPPP